MTEIKYNTIPYSDFQNGDIIDAEKIDLNYKALVDKQNEVITNTNFVKQEIERHKTGGDHDDRYYPLSKGSLLDGKVNMVNAEITSILRGAETNLEVAQAHVGTDAKVYDTLKQRLDTEFSLLSASTVNAKMFGLVGDGVTDNSSAIEQMLKSNSKNIVVPEGVYKITRQLTALTGSPKKVIGVGNVVFSVTLGVDVNLASIGINIAFENITFDFNSGNVKMGLLYASNLGEINLKNITFKNIKDVGNTYSSNLVMINTVGNTLAIDGLRFENIRKLGNNNIADGGGSINGLYVTYNSATANYHTSGYITNFFVKNMHNIDSNNNIIFEDTSGMYIITATNDSLNNINISNVRGENFGKRLIKLHASNINIDNVYGYSSTGDSLSVIGANNAQGLGDKSNIKINNVTARGNIPVAIADDTIGMTVTNIDVDTDKSTLTGNTSDTYGIMLSGSNTVVDNIKASTIRAVVLNESEADMKNISINKLRFTAKTVNGFGFSTTGTKGVDGLRLTDILLDCSNSSFGGNIVEFGNLTPTTGYAHKNFFIKNFTAIGSSVYGSGSFFKHVDGLTIEDYTYTNPSSVQQYRALRIENCNNVNLKNIKSIGSMGSTSSFVATSNIIIDSMTSTNSALDIGFTTSTNIRLSNVNASMVGWNDGSSRNATLFSQYYRVGLTGARNGVPTQGEMYYDTTLGKPIWWNGTVWKDAVGTTV